MIARALVASLLSLALVPQSGLPAKSQPPRAPAGVVPVRADPYEQHIFFAILEGLYQDGVSNDVVDKIIVIDDQTKYPANFVWACPVCMPAYNAFHLYRGRPSFHEKMPRDTFGPGLAPALVERLTAVDLAVTQAALEELIEGWMNRRMDSLRLTDGERADWRMEMEKRRKEGMSYLEGYRKAGLGGSYAWMKTCPMCEGAN